KGDKYQLDVMLNTYNIVCQENGGIADDAFILTPDDVNDGRGGIDTKSIPINLYNAFNRVKGKNYYATQRYNWGHYQTKTVNDTTEVETYVPIMSFIHTIEYNDNERRFIDKDSADNVKNYKNAYINKLSTNDTTSYWTLKNTLGVSLLEGFNKHAKMGISAYATYEIRRFKLMANPINSATLTTPSLPILPDLNYPHKVEQNQHIFTENILWIGGELSKKQGSLITYNVNGKFGLTGPELGSIDIGGSMQTKFKFMKDSLTIRAYGFFKNIQPSFYYRKYVSNHFLWDNNFGKIRKFRVGGEVDIPSWGTYINVGFENVQNYVFFNNMSLPEQESASIQIFSATLKQRFKVSIVHLDLEAVYQASSKQSTIPLPALSAYGNFYIQFKIAKVLHTQIGVDCRYNTAYYGEAYQPATLSFHVQDEYKVGNYPIMTAYANMKLKMVRFYVMYSHFNKGLFGSNNYFSMPHYPLNPGSFQFGLSIDFAN
ncbi:MAG: putative porin, partial [Bacteroidales bacterium]